MILIQNKVARSYYKTDSDKLSDQIILELKLNGQIRRTSRSIWPQFCQSVINSAHLLNGFESSESFNHLADLFVNDDKAKPALPMLIRIEIAGIGFPLTDTKHFKLDEYPIIIKGIA